MKLLFHNNKPKHTSIGRICLNIVGLCQLVKNVIAFFPQLSSYLHFLFFPFSLYPNNVVLPRQPSNALEHTLSLQRTAQGVVEKITGLLAAWMFHGEASAIQVAQQEQQWQQSRQSFAHFGNLK